MGAYALVRCLQQDILPSIPTICEELHLNLAY